MSDLKCSHCGWTARIDALKEAAAECRKIATWPTWSHPTAIRCAEAIEALTTTPARGPEEADTSLMRKAARTLGAAIAGEPDRPSEATSLKVGDSVRRDVSDPLGRILSISDGNATVDFYPGFTSVLRIQVVPLRRLYRATGL